MARTRRFPPDRSRSPAASDLTRGRAAYDRREWQTAYEALSAADEAASLGADDLWLLASAAFLVGHEAAFVAALERVHGAHLDAGDPTPAARAAIWLGLHLAERGEPARATGWFGRADRVLEGVSSGCAERGYLLLPQGIRHLASGDHETAARLAGEAAECAQQFGDRDLLALAVHLQGRARLRQARVEEGLALLDEAMVAVTTGELSPQVTGLIYCSVISACRRVWALDRAHEWTAALTDWCEAQPEMVAFRGECRVYRAELMRLHGSWGAALDEAERVGPDGPGGGPVVGAAQYQRGEVHRLRGEYEAAESAYRSASRAGREPQPGLALLRLAQGGDDAAAAAIRRTLAEAREPLARARLLPAQVEIMLAVGESDEAEQACRELEATAEAYGTSVLGTMAAFARGAVALDRGDPGAALEPLRSAWRAWQGLEAPWDAARARELLGRACLELGDDEAGALELDAARAAYEELGARPDVARVEGLERSGSSRAGRVGAGSGPARDDHGLTPRQLEVLAELATGKTNRAIAGTLFISEKTVARHVSDIFAKLGVSSRAAATAYAYEHGLAGSPE